MTRRRCGCVFREVPHHHRPVGRQPVSDHHEGGSQLAVQVGENRHDASRVDLGIGVQPEVQLHPVPFRRDAMDPTTLTLRQERVR